MYNSGLHRFFFLLFKQSKPLSAIQLSEIVELFNQRDGFAFQKWIKRMGFVSGPAAINGFYAGWEEYCDVIHEKIGYVPPEQYRSPTQESRVQREEDRRRLEQTKLALYKDLGLKDIFGLADDDPKLLSSPSLECCGMRIVYADEGNIVPIDGAVLTPIGTMQMPSISFEQLSMSGEFYTLVMTDPDAPSRLKPDFREFVHWVIMNIDGSSGGDLATGHTILPYLGPAPPYSSGLHRYVFTLYKQKDRIAQKDLDFATSFFEPRGGLRTYQFIRNQSDKFFPNPIAIDAFLCEWDQIVDDLHERMQWLPPDPFRSPAQKLKAMQSDMASIHDLEKEKELLKQRQEAWEQEQFERLKAAEEIYKSRAQDIDILALTAAVRAADVEHSTDADVLAAASMDQSFDEGDSYGLDTAVQTAASANSRAGSSKTAHRKPIVLSSVAAATPSDGDEAAFDSYVQNAKAVDRSVLDRAGNGAVVVEEITQTTEVASTHRETVEEVSETTRTIEAKVSAGGPRSILDKIDQELAEQEARAAQEQAEHAKQLQAQLEAEAKEQERLREQRIREEAAAAAAAAEAERLRQEQIRQEEAVRAEAERVARERAEAERLRREQEERERAAERERLERERVERERIEREKERLEREKAEAERLQRIVEEQKRIIEMQQQQQQLLIQQQQLFIQQQQQQQELLQRSNSSSRRSQGNALSPSVSVDQGDNDSVDNAPPPYFSSPSAGSGKRVGFSANTGGRPAPLTHSHSGDSDDNASNASYGSRPSVASTNSRSSNNGRPAVGIQRSPSMLIRDQSHAPAAPLGSPSVGQRSPMISSPQPHAMHPHLVHHDDLDAMLQPGRSSVMQHDYDDDATITSMGSLIPPSGRSVSPPPSRPGSSSMASPAPPPPIQTGSPSWQRPANQQPSPSHANSAVPPAPASQPGTPASTLIRRVSLFKPQSQFIQVPGGSADESDNHSASSAYTAGGTPMNQPGAYLGPSTTAAGAGPTKQASLLKQTTSIYLKSGAGTTNQTSSQDALTASSGLTPDEVRERLLDPVTPTTEKCVIFNISSPSVFDGGTFVHRCVASSLCRLLTPRAPCVAENVKKKFSKDFLAKDSFMWIDPLRKSLHW